MSDKAADHIPQTLGLGLPRMEVIRAARHTATEGSVVRGIRHQEGSLPDLTGDEPLLGILSGGWTIQTAVDDGGCVPPDREEPVGKPLLATIAAHGVGLAIVTDRRMVGAIFDAPALGIDPKGDMELLWEMPFELMNSVGVLRRRKGSRLKDVGLTFDASDGSAGGAVGVGILDEILLPSRRPKKVKDYGAFVSPIVSLIFDAAVAATGDSQLLSELAVARERGWVPDPDAPDDLLVEIPRGPRVSPSEGEPTPAEAPVDVAAPAPEPEPVSEPEPGSAPEPEPDLAAAPAADWYPDPSGQARLRYWDGGRWTEHVAD
ncbi:MAG: DUF2510 domain-containing protein [Actinomycetota bacterium]